MILRTRRAEDVMRRLSVVSLVIGLLAAGPGLVAMAQAPSPSPQTSEALSATGGRFVLPEGGYAVTFPDGWEVLILPVEWSPIPVVRAEEGHDGEVSDAVPFCEVKVHGPCDDQPGRTCATIIDEEAADEVAWWQSGADIEVPSAVASEAVALPAGYAVRIDVTYSERDSDRAFYWLTDGHVLVSLLCLAARGPDDRWLSVAETFEFLAEG
jgi:hypothetical protein